MPGQELSKEGVKGDQWGEAFEGGGPGKALGRWCLDRDLNEAKGLSDLGGTQAEGMAVANSPRKEELSVSGGGLASGRVCISH